MYKNIKNRSQKLPDIQKEFIKFVLIGTFSVMVDLVLYYIFLEIFPEKFLSLLTNEMASKALSFIGGLAVTYYFNLYWTWKLRGYPQGGFMLRFTILYSGSLILNVFTNSSFLYLLHNSNIFDSTPHKYLIAFIVATALSGILNFI
ncbi:MAG: GtrA family protein, partial [Bacteroidales bacterium]|nr:GtrA family protein [Bacteroidales bacterium]